MTDPQSHIEQRIATYVRKFDDGRGNNQPEAEALLREALITVTRLTQALEEEQKATQFTYRAGYEQGKAEAEADVTRLTQEYDIAIKMLTSAGRDLVKAEADLLVCQQVREELEDDFRAIGQSTEAAAKSYHALRDTNKRLNRRCQSAEAALNTKVEDYEKRAHGAVRGHYFMLGQEAGKADIAAIQRGIAQVIEAIHEEAKRMGPEWLTFVALADTLSRLIQKEQE